ncbi:MAG: squalene--hopene cyclase [Verrucomicrobia bacterium]|nr:squalene--hopene cyclase [Verrucomicrobiota bacterium]
MAHHASSKSRLERNLAHATRHLLAALGPEGHWVGELSSSPLSTATAITALAVYQQNPSPPTPPNTSRPSPNNPPADVSPNPELAGRIRTGLAWLASHQNADGGWGDTTASASNLSTTTLGWAAFGAVAHAGLDLDCSETVVRAEAWLRNNLEHIDPERLATAILRRYGKDRTFSIPILTMCALAGKLGSGPSAWRHVLPLPFELAAFPARLFSWLRFPVVSYALPALIAIGQARHHHLPSPNPLTRTLRTLLRGRTLAILERIQPSNGGFLEAPPLTSFVAMSLAASGQASHPVTRRGIEFLKRAQRPDGSWPIDTNLATWLTTLAVNALPPDIWTQPPAQEPPSPACRHPHPGPHAQNPPDHPAPGREAWRQQLRCWLLAQQHTRTHPYTHAPPGGWAWTDLPGGVPDADDTAGALLALHRLAPSDPEVRAAATAGVRWLIGLQNGDGGIATFCRGWGHLPFDRSSADITAHALRAWMAWRPLLPRPLLRRLDRAIRRAGAFLARVQRPDGSWEPLWFGSPWAPDDRNPAYGTSRVLLGLAAIRGLRARRGAAERFRDFIRLIKNISISNRNAVPGPARRMEAGARWLMAAQHADGSWGGSVKGPASVEETALVLEALSAMAAAPCAADQAGQRRIAIRRGADWLMAELDRNPIPNPTPIGFYFAKLWYFEKLYPLIFAVGAFRSMAENLEVRGEAVVENG